jgi:photosystem II stability/assembly factor-like uncharacterized protein
MIACKSVCLKIVGVLFWLTAISIVAEAHIWTQTDWSGGPGQLSWNDTTMFFTGSNMDGWRSPGDLKLGIPDDANWINTGNLAGADQAWGLMEASDGAIYVGAGPGGNVFKTVDAGTTWVNTGNLAGANYVWTVIEASDGAIYAGTGPTNGDVFKTIDAGTTWTNTGDLTGAAYAWCLMEASDGALYAGTANNLQNDGNVFKSFDAGTTWTETGNLAGAGQVFSLIDASDGAIYAATTPGGNVFKTVDAGTTWVNTGNLSGAGWVWTVIEASNGAIYAGTGPSNGDVFKSIDAGTTWTNTGNLSGAQWVSSLIETSDGAIYAGTYNAGNVFKSINAGTTWANTGNLAGATDVYSFMEASDGALYAGTWWNGDVFKAGCFLSGELVSSVYLTENASVTYDTMSWNETLQGQTIVIKVRTDTLPDMSTAVDWDSCPPVVNGQDISSLSSIDDFNRYIQYQVQCSTGSSDLTPLLHDINLEYTVDVDGPIPDSAIAFDGTNPVPGIDDDDFILVYFDQTTTKPFIDALNIDSVLSLSVGHSWLDGFGSLDTTYWNPLGDMLMIELSVNVSPPTVAVGDTVTPDGVTITDEWGNPSIIPVIITGSFYSVGIEESETFIIPKFFSLTQNHPNPFNKLTAISYIIPAYSSRQLAISEKIPVRFAIYDLSGRLVETLVDEPQEPGIYQLPITNNQLPRSGIYFYRLQAGSFTSTKKMIFLR